MKEIWKNIDGFDDRYQISDRGRVKIIETGVILKQYLSSNGYLFVRPYKDRKNHNKYIHRLVAEHFIPNPCNLPEVNHKDENKTNNIVSNLEWCDRSYNINYGTRSERASITMSKPIVQFDKNGNKLNEFYGLHDAMRQTGIDFRNIQRCCAKKIKSVGGYVWRYANERL